MRLLKISIAGVRGIVGQTITPELVLNFASAFGTYLGEGSVLVGRDTRPSGPMLHEACISSLISTGCNVIDLGICPTPIIQFMVKKLNAKGAISVTAGHNGKDWNALTFINNEGTYLNSFQGDEVLDIYHLGQFASMPVRKLGKVERYSDYIETYLKALSGFIDTESIHKANLRIVVDCCNGAGAGLFEEFGRFLGCEIIAVNNERNGFFPHDPEPGIPNAQQAVSVMNVLRADAAFLTNSDVSRISIIAARDEALSEEFTFPLIAQHYLTRKKGTVVSTVMTSKMIDDVAKKMDCHVERSRVGQSHVIETMILEDAVIAGEGSGGVAISDFQPAFDGFMSIALILEAVATSGRALKDIIRELPQYHLVKEKVICALPRAYSLVNEIKRFYPGDWVETSDGLRLDTETGWIHLRASATEPLVRIYVEDASKEKAREMADSIVHFFPEW